MNWFKRKEKIPKHEVVNKDSCLDYRLSLDVVLLAFIPTTSEKAINEDLTVLSNHLYKKHKGKKFERVFICYYLPGMEIDAGAWATGHFDPELEVKILE